jgi:methionine-S-sulfoxide reductase
VEAALREIWLAGGCFWGVQAYLARVPGVAQTRVGYANGKTQNPTYKEVCTQKTGHAETVYVRYDPARISLETLLEYFFGIIDPTSLNRQGNDRGLQYRTGIYYRDAKDVPVIRMVLARQQKRLDRPVVTEVEVLQQFFPAEEEHQEYLEKNPGGYCHVSFASLPRPGTNSESTGAVDQVEEDKP